jgi:hypothetical protein
MTRGFNTALVSILLSSIVATAITAHGAPPAPAPTGTIYYRVGTSINSVKADGSSHTLNLLPGWISMTQNVNSFPNPAFYRSGSNSTHDRWYIGVGITGTYDEYVSTVNGQTLYDYPHYDLFAIRSNPANRSQLITVQLTDLYGIVSLSALASWSNDDNDGPASFVTCAAHDLRDAYEELEDPDTGEIITRVNTPLATFTDARVPLTLTELDLGGYVPISADTISESELDAMLAYDLFTPGRLDFQGSISPDGSRFLSAPNAEQTLLRISDVHTGSPLQTLWDGSTTAPNIMFAGCHQWSPSGTTIAIGERLSTYPRGGNIWTQPADASAAPKKVLSATTSGSTKTSYSQPLWSPDNQFLVALKLRYSGTTLNGAWLTRVKLSDGKSTDIVSVSTASIPYPLRWVTNN